MPALRRRWTTADVRALMDESRHWPRYELIAGELQVTPAPGGLHQFAVQEIALMLGNHLRVEPVGAVLTSPADLELAPGTIVQPDVFVIATDTVIAGDRLERDRLTWNPRSTPLVVDVAALFSRIDDTARTFKKSIRP